MQPDSAAGQALSAHRGAGRRTGFDYVIVGAGSAGCTLAGRLTEDPSVRVLLLEAGGWDRSPWIHLPLGWGRIVPARRHDWHYDSEPERELADREIECTRGKVVGGCSSVNAMAYVRGHRGDYDRWAAAGLEGWSYADVLPLFKRQESWEDGDSEYRGGAGPIGTRRTRFDDPITGAYFEAGRRAGFPITDDYNGAQQEGLGLFQLTVRNGRRCSAATAYLRPALARPNLRVEVGAQATAILFEGTRVTGVEYVQRGSRERVAIDRELLLAGGVINSPQLLMLSGIGDPEQLAAHGIGVRSSLPGVGRNLRDHLWASVEYRRREPGTFHRDMRLDRVAWGLARGWVGRSGPWTDLPSGWTAFLRTPLAGALPDVQLLFRCMPAGAGPWLPPWRPPYADGFCARATLLRPASHGTVSLRSSNPLEPARIRFDFLSAEYDRKVLRAGLRLIRELGAQAPLSPYIAGELLPGPTSRSDADLDAHIRATSATAHHPMGTCRMGVDGDPMAVVDAQLRVFGVQGLRVVDASVMPDHVGGNIHAPVVMIAEKAVDLLRRDSR